MSAKNPASWSIDYCLLTVFSQGGRPREASGVSFLRALISLMRVPHSGAPLPNTITLGTRISTSGFAVNTNTQSITLTHTVYFILNISNA